MKVSSPVLLLPVSIVYGLSACSSGSTAGVDGSEETAPDYAAAFPQDRVETLKLKIDPSDWDAMLADMAVLAGEFGARGGLEGGGMGIAPGMGMVPGMGAPPELLVACVGLLTGDPCSLQIGETELTGTCTVSGEETLCQPDLGGLPPGGRGPMGGGGNSILAGTPIYVETSVEFAGLHWDHVGVRFKGNSSLASSWGGGSYKLPLRLDFDHYDDIYPDTDKQRFLGFEHISLSNGWSDSSFVRDKLGTDIFADFGVAVPATAFYRVEIDHGAGPVYFGLYTAIELPSDRSFLDRSFAGHEGNLYKPEGTGATWAVFDSATLGKENHEDVADFTDAAALFDALHADRTDATVWRAGLEKSLNVEVFLRWLALNTVIQDWDSYGNMSHNYYLYADPNDAGRFRWIPWDHTFAFSGAGGIGQSQPLDLSTVTEAWPLIRFLVDDPVYGSRYRALVAEAAELYAPAKAQARFQQAHDLIASSVVGGHGEIAEHTLLSSPDAFETAHTALLAHPVERAAAVAAFVRQ
jgi:hypothetical protein